MHGAPRRGGRTNADTVHGVPTGFGAGQSSVGRPALPTASGRPARYDPAASLRAESGAKSCDGYRFSPSVGTSTRTSP